MTIYSGGTCIRPSYSSCEWNLQGLLGAEGASFEEAERHFRKLLLKMTVLQHIGDTPQLTVLECQKIAPFFTTT